MTKKELKLELEATERQVEILTNHLYEAVEKNTKSNIFQNYSLPFLVISLLLNIVLFSILLMS